MQRLASARTILRWLAHGLIPDLTSNMRGSPLYNPLPPPTSARANRGIAVVTGGTGGLGAPVCLGLAARGFEVVVATRDKLAGQLLVEEMTAAGGSASFELCDLSTPGGAAALACSLLDRGPIALLVNNAGVMGGSYAETMAVNAIAPAVLSIGLMPQLALSESPRIVNVASSAHLRASRVAPSLVQSRERDRSLTGYSASKLALLHLSTLLREALPGAPNLVVNDCHPGLVWTPLLRRAYGARLGAWLERRVGLRRRIARDPETGAETILAACLALTDSGPQAGGACSGESDALAVVEAVVEGNGAAGYDGDREEQERQSRRQAGRTYFIDGAPARSSRAQSAESRDLEAARQTWSDVLSDSVQPATVAIDVTRRTKGIDAQRLRFSLYAFERGYRLGDDGRLEATI